MTLVDSRPGIQATLDALAARDRATPRSPTRTCSTRCSGATSTSSSPSASRPIDAAALADRFRELYVDLGVPGTDARSPGAARRRRRGPRGRRAHRRGHRQVRAQRAPLPRPRRPRGRRGVRVALRRRQGRDAARRGRRDLRRRHAQRRAGGARARTRITVARHDRPARRRPSCAPPGRDVVLELAGGVPRMVGVVRIEPLCWRWMTSRVRAAAAPPTTAPATRPHATTIASTSSHPRPRRSMTRVVSGTDVDTSTGAFAAAAGSIVTGSPGQLHHHRQPERVAAAGRAAAASMRGRRRPAGPGAAATTLGSSVIPVFRSREVERRRVAA